MKPEKNRVSLSDINYNELIPFESFVDFLKK